MHICEFCDNMKVFFCIFDEMWFYKCDQICSDEPMEYFVRKACADNSNVAKIQILNVVAFNLSTSNDIRCFFLSSV